MAVAADATSTQGSDPSRRRPAEGTRLPMNPQTCSFALRLELPMGDEARWAAPGPTPTPTRLRRQPLPAGRSCPHITSSAQSAGRRLEPPAHSPKVPPAEAAIMAAAFWLQRPRPYWQAAYAAAAAVDLDLPPLQCPAGSASPIATVTDLTQASMLRRMASGVQGPCCGITSCDHGSASRRAGCRQARAIATGGCSRPPLGALSSRRQPRAARAGPRSLRRHSSWIAR